MPNLKFLKFYRPRTSEDGRKMQQHVGLNVYLPNKLRLLYWYAYPLQTLPSQFRPDCLVELNMSRSKLEKLWEGIQSLWNLKRMDLSWSLNLKEIPDLSKATNLEELVLAFCESLVEFPSSIQGLNKLYRLDMTSCSEVECFPTKIDLKSLRFLNLRSCKNLKRFPEISRSVERLNLSWTGVEEMAEPIEHLTELQALEMSSCQKLKNIPITIGNLTALRYLNLCRCHMLENIPSTIQKLNNLSILYLDGCENIPSTIGILTNLSSLSLNGCENIPNTIGNVTDLRIQCLKWCKNIPCTIESLKSLEYLSLNRCKLPGISNLTGLVNLKLSCCEIHWSTPNLGCLPLLKALDLSGNNFETIPTSIKQFSKLRVLNLDNCENLRSLPKLPPTRLHLYASGFTGIDI